MASTYSPSLRLELMATGDQSGTWGDTTNTNLGTLLEQSITGYLSKAMADANQTLTNLNGASDEARNMVVEVTGALTGAKNVVVPTAEKIYLFKNSTTGGFAVTIKTSAGTGVAVPMNEARWVYCDGTNIVDGLGTLGLTFGGTGATSAAAARTNLAVPGLATANTFTASQTITPAAGAGELLIGSGGANTLGRQIVFNNQAGTPSGYLQLVPNTAGTDSVLNVYVGGGGGGDLKASINDDGLLTLTAGQIKFPAVANPSADPNTLDDYEEQNTTPTPVSTGGTFTAASSSLHTTKIGRLVTVNGRITITTVGTATGNVQVTVPFTSALQSGGGGRESTTTGRGLAVGLPTGSAVLTLNYADGSSPIGAGNTLDFSISYTV